MPAISGDSRWACLMIDHDPFFENKAGNRDVIVPGGRNWAAFSKRVKAVAMLPRWANGFTAAAEVLDRLGYAIAESLVAAMAFGIESDEGLVYWTGK